MSGGCGAGGGGGGGSGGGGGGGGGYSANPGIHVSANDVWDAMNRLGRGGIRNDPWITVQPCAKSPDYDRNESDATDFYVKVNALNGDRESVVLTGEGALKYIKGKIDAHLAQIKKRRAAYQAQIDKERRAQARKEGQALRRVIRDAKRKLKKIERR